MEIDYGKILLLMLAWFAFKEIIPDIASNIVYFFYECVYYVIKKEHSVYYWRIEDERTDRRDTCVKRKKRGESDNSKNIGFYNDEIKS